MTTVAVAYGSIGKHTPAYTTIRELEADNRRLIAGTEERDTELHTALVRGCQDAMRIAQVEAENEALKARVKELGDKVIRGAAEHARLRQAVINARPRISVAVQRLDRPYVAHVQIPYPVPVGRDLSADDTQELPLLDQPEAWPAYRMRSA